MARNPVKGERDWDVANNARHDDIDVERDRALAAEAEAKVVAQRTVTGNASITDADDVLFVNSAVTARTVTLPDATTALSKFFTVKNIGAAGVTVATVASQTIDGNATYGPLAQNELIDFLTDGANWRAF